MSSGSATKTWLTRSSFAQKHFDSIDSEQSNKNELTMDINEEELIQEATGTIILPVSVRSAGLSGFARSKANLDTSPTNSKKSASNELNTNMN